MARVVVRASRDQREGMECSVGTDGITRGMRSRKHAQTRPSPVPVALLLIDVLTTFQFPDGDAILQGALTNERRAGEAEGSVRVRPASLCCM